MKSGILARPIIAALAVVSVSSVASAGSGLGTVIQEAAALQPVYGFAAECAATGDLDHNELAQFRAQLLDVLTERHGLTVEDRLVAQAYLVGEAEVSEPALAIVPAGGGFQETRSCDSATKLM